MADIETDVLIVGSGPAGSSMGLFLSTLGIDNLVITRFHRLVRTPRAHLTNQRTMEILRDAGVADQVIAQATPQELLGNNVFCTSLAGEELGRLHAWGNHPTLMAEHKLASPTDYVDLPQNLMEPILARNADLRGTHIRYETDYVSHIQDDDGVTVTARDRLTGADVEILCKFLYGADGGNSLVADHADLPFEGEMGVGGSINIVFEADLAEYVEHRPSCLYWVLQSGAEVGGVGAGVIRMVRPWNKWLIVWGYDIEQGEPDLNEEVCLRIVRNLVGNQELDVDVDSWSTWKVNNLYGTSYSTGRVLCGGDAVHRHPPTNGLGSNISIQDSYNLAWKLAYVLKGLAGPELLKSFSDERMPIGKATVLRANQSILDFGPIIGALGLMDATSPEDAMARIESRKDDTAVGRERREGLRKGILSTQYIFNAHGLEMNQRYESAAVVPDGTADPGYERDPVLHYEATTRPGARLPHCWFRSGQHSIDVVSSLDLAGHGRFTLFTGIGGDGWVEAATVVGERLGLDIATVTVGPGCDVEDVYQDWPDLRGVDEDGVLLVRPDVYVGWRAPNAQGDQVARLETALRAILARPA